MYMLKYNNTYHRTIAMKPTDVKSSPYFDFEVESNDIDRKCKVCDHAQISKYKNNFAKRYTRN